MGSPIGPWVIPHEKSRCNLCHIILPFIHINFMKMRIMVLVLKNSNNLWNSTLVLVED